MPAMLQQEFLNQNAGRAYPIQEDMGRVPYDSTGNLIVGLQLPNYVIVDMVVTVPGDAGMRLYLSQFTYAGTVTSFAMSETVGNAVVATVSVDLATHTPNRAYVITGTGDWSDVRGWLVVGDLSSLAKDMLQGRYSFTRTQTLFEACVVRPALRGVRSISVNNNGNVSYPLSGHVNLVAGSNIRLAYDQATNSIWVHASPNSGYQDTCPCSENNGILKTINGIPVEDAVIVGDGQCVEVTTSGNTITITDKCSTPCCGCPELDYLNQTVAAVQASIEPMLQFASALSDQITKLVQDLQVVGSAKGLPLGPMVPPTSP